MQFYPMEWGKQAAILVPIVTEMPWRESVVLVMPFENFSIGTETSTKFQEGDEFMRAKRIRRAIKRDSK